MKDSEKTKIVYKALKERYYKPSRFVVPNIYFFPEPYTETDFLVVNRNNHIYDIEVKVSKSDFKNDFKKTAKHEIIQTGKYTLKSDRMILTEKTSTRNKFKQVFKGDKQDCGMRPSRFYYCTPKGLLSIEDIPSYAGLLEVDLKTKKITEAKAAPLLSKAPARAEIDKILVDKFYYRMK